MVYQFIVAKPAKALQTRFNYAENTSKVARVLFLGTPFANLHSILQDGFKAPVAMGLWLADEPSYSWGFALKTLAVGDGEGTKDKDTSYPEYGVLFGCEMVGKDEI